MSDRLDTLALMMIRTVKLMCKQGMQQCPGFTEPAVFAFFLGVLPRLMLQVWGVERSFEFLDQMRDLLRSAARKGAN